MNDIVKTNQAKRRELVISLVAEILELDDPDSIRPTDRLREDLGMDSLGSLELLSTISEEYQWFTDEIYDTYLAPCRQCFVHYVLISHQGQEKGATATDGTTAMPSEYGFTLSVITPMLPQIAVP